MDERLADAGYQRNKLRVTKLSPFHDYLQGRQAAAQPDWIPATVLLREIVALRCFFPAHPATLPIRPKGLPMLFV